VKSETDRGGSIIAAVIAAALLLLAIAGGAKLLPKNKTASARPACVASDPCSADPPTGERN
jgi:hypothetical protein